MPYLLLKTLILLHCGNPSKNLSSKVSYFEVLKAFLASVCGDRSKEEMGNTIIPLGNGGDEGTPQWMKSAGIAIDEQHFCKVARVKLLLKLTNCF